MNVTKKEVVFEDERGRITDILENEVVEYVTLISSKKGAVRGNHYHKESVQFMFVLKGRMRMYAQIENGKVRTRILESGDLAFTPPKEKHALIALENSEFLVFTRGPRGGRNYNTDTYRLAEKLTPNKQGYKNLENDADEDFCI